VDAARQQEIVAPNDIRGVVAAAPMALPRLAAQRGFTVTLAKRPELIPSNVVADELRRPQCGLVMSC
jgi:hypothetical protein